LELAADQDVGRNGQSDTEGLETQGVVVKGFS
jgi:hypothetical protein